MCHKWNIPRTVSTTTPNIVASFPLAVEMTHGIDDSLPMHSSYSLLTYKEVSCSCSRVSVKEVPGETSPRLLSCMYEEEVAHNRACVNSTVFGAPLCLLQGLLPRFCSMCGLAGAGPPLPSCLNNANAWLTELFII